MCWIPGKGPLHPPTVLRYLLHLDGLGEEDVFDLLGAPVHFVQGEFRNVVGFEQALVLRRVLLRQEEGNNVDFAGRIVWGEVKGPDGQPVLDSDGNPKLIEVFNFGKHKGLPVTDVLRMDPGYYSWILAGDFTYNTKQVLTRIRLREAKMNK